MSEDLPYQIIALDASAHDRAGFDCGEIPLNRYLREQASQEIKRKVAGCWVLVSLDRPDRVLGYYTLSTEAVDMKELGEADAQVAKKLPRYPRLGAVLLGRLAVSKTEQKKGLGELLLFDAMHRVVSTQIPAVFMITDPKDESAGKFYSKYGFRPLSPARLFITTQQIGLILGLRD
jgi:predicted GNAT family N-acyltransferase